MDIKLSYGLKDGKLVHISEIAPHCKGNNCNCVCPECGMPLCAKIGKIKQPHFSHQKDSTCDSKTAQETALHLLAKEIIKENDHILLPGWTIMSSEFRQPEMDLPAFYEVVNSFPFPIAEQKETRIKYDSADLEKRYGDIIADAVINTHGRACLIEIHVFHPVDEQKKQKVKELNLPMVEIHLGDLLNSPMDRDTIQEAVLSYASNRKWINNPKREAKFEIVKKEILNKYLKELDAREAKAQKKSAFKEKSIAELRRDFEAENYKKELLKLHNDRAANAFLQNLYNKPFDEFPFYTNIPITGEFVFGCDRRIWQTFLFDTFVLNRFKNEVFTVNLHYVQEYINKYGAKKGVNFITSRAYATSVVIGDHIQKIALTKDVIRQYFEYLRILGFVSQFGPNSYISKEPQSLAPPNQEAACALQTILSSVDLYAPNIDEIINDELSKVFC